MSAGVSMNSSGADHTALTSWNKTGSIPSTVQSLKDLKKEELKGARVSAGDELLIKKIEQANKAVQGMNTSLEFSIHDKTKQIMVKVKDQETGELIREIPSEKILDLVANLLEMSGIFVDEKR